MRVLASAYACEPGKGSEPGVGWNWVRQIARFHDVWVITRANNRLAIEAALAVNPMANVRWVYFDFPNWMRFWKRKNRGIHAYYYFWQLGAYRIARGLHDQVRFDLIHHLTFANYWMPALTALLPVPFVWGPVGGGQSSPPQFWSSFGPRGIVYELARHLARWFGGKNTLVRMTARRAAFAMATNEETRQRLEALGCQKLAVYSEAGLPSEEVHLLGKFPLRQNGGFRVLSVGNLLHFKGFDLAVRAFAELLPRVPTSEFWIVGDGPERARLEKMTRQFSLEDHVRFWGWLPRSAVLDHLAECDVLLHPSLHESGGWVCLEAMAAARPVVCLDLGGPALQVTNETGIKVEPTTPEQTVASLADALTRLALEPATRARLGRAGRLRIEEDFSWNRKGDYLEEVYRSVVREQCPVIEA